MNDHEFVTPASVGRRPLSWAALLTVAAGYCIAGRIALLLAVPPGYATAIWPSAGLALAAVLIYGYRIWPAVWAGSFTVNLWISFAAVASGDTKAIVVAAMIACGASVQAVWSAWLICRFATWPNALENGKTIARLVILGGALGCVANAFIGVSSLWLVGLIDISEFGFNWFNWWVGDAIGVIVTTPLLLIWSGVMGGFWRRRAVATSVPIAVALFVVVVFFLVASNREQARIESEFNDTALNIDAAIQHRVHSLTAVLDSVRSLYASSENVEPEEFRVFTRKALQTNPDLLAVSWNPRIEQTDRDAYEQAEGLIFTERDARGVIREALQRDEYVVVRYIEPMDVNRDALGFDVASDPTRLEAMLRARDTAEPAATGRLHLVQAQASEPGLLIFVPIYDTPTQPQTVQERRASISGYAVGVVPITQFLAAAIGGFQLEHIFLRLYDESAESGHELLASYADNNGETDPLLTAERYLSFAGRTWRLNVGAGAEYVAEHRAPGLVMVLAIGLLLCGLLGVFTLILTGHERREAIRAAHDPLTGLVNRGEFEHRLRNALSSCSGQGARHALAYCDLDQFKLINDTAGHQAGDQLLRKIATLMQTNLRGRDTVARLGGDEFGLLLENCPIEKAGEICTRICADVRGFRFQWNDKVFQVGVSIGVIVLNADTGDVADAMSQADVACYTAKDLGRNRVHVDHAGSKLVRHRRSELQRVADLRNTMEHNALLLYKQPILAIDQLDAAPIAVECLLRLRGSDGEILPPGNSIAAAERFGMMAEVDRWVIRHALQQSEHLFAESTMVSINLSANSLDDDKLAQYICSEVARSDVTPQQLCFEITETAAVSNLESAVRFMEQMKSKGYRFALDDFGAGISSFRYLKTLPVDWLKIDGSLIECVANEEAARAMVAAVQQIAETMGIATVAEWVSNQFILATLREIGVGYVQGFALGHPVPLTTKSSVLLPA